MKTVSLGNKKKQYASIKLAAAQYGINYITLYQRLRMGMTLAQAVRVPVRAYRRRSVDRGMPLGLTAVAQGSV